MFKMVCPIEVFLQRHTALAYSDCAMTIKTFITVIAYLIIPASKSTQHKTQRQEKSLFSKGPGEQTKIFV